MKSVKGAQPLIYEKIKLYSASITGPLQNFIKYRAVRRVKKILKMERFEVITGLNDIVSATKALQDFLNNSNVSLLEELKKL